MLIIWSENKVLKTLKMKSIDRVVPGISMESQHLTAFSRYFPHPPFTLKLELDFTEVLKGTEPFSSHKRWKYTNKYFIYLYIVFVGLGVRCNLISVHPCCIVQGGSRSKLRPQATKATRIQSKSAVVL